eukprot:jgi/Chlat1/3046/Chrsp208S08793
MQLGMSPYAGSVFHAPPLVLTLLGPLAAFPSEGMEATAASRIMRHSPASPNPNTVAALFLFNPYSIASCVGRSLGTIVNGFVFMALAAAASGDVALATFGVAVAGYLSLHPILLIVPVLLLLSSGLDTPSTEPRPTNTKTTLHVLLLFITWCVALILLSALALRSHGGLYPFLKGCYGFIISVEDITPNQGLYWYFFTEMFDHFRPFFLFVFQAIGPIMLSPLAIRYRHRPLFLAYLISGLISVLQPYPSIADTAQYIALLPVISASFADFGLGLGFVIANLFVYTTLLGPILHHMWVNQYVGNANFYYAVTLLFGVAQGLLLVESVMSVNRFDRALKMKLREEKRTPHEQLQAADVQ